MPVADPIHYNSGSARQQSTLHLDFIGSNGAWATDSAMA